MHRLAHRFARIAALFFGWKASVSKHSLKPVCRLPVVCSRWIVGPHWLGTSNKINWMATRRPRPKQHAMTESHQVRSRTIKISKRNSKCATSWNRWEIEQLSSFQTEHSAESTLKLEAFSMRSASIRWLQNSPVCSYFSHKNKNRHPNILIRNQ